jgi:amino acid transporter
VLLRRTLDGDRRAGFESRVALLLVVFMYTGWDATVYVNEEVTHRRVNPGQSAVIAVGFLVVIFTVTTVGLQGAVSPARLQTNSSSALVYVAQALAGPGWAKVMALALALSVIATTGVSIVILARIMYGMASHRVLPSVLGRVSPRFRTPAAGSILTGLILIAVIWAYLLSSSIASAFTTLIDVTSILTLGYYILTALAAIVYYRCRVFGNAWDALLAGIMPCAAAGFLGWIVVRSLQAAPWSQRWSLAGIIAVGVVLMFNARFTLRSPFFQTPRESAPREP